MKKIYDREVRVQIGKYGQDWENTSMWSHFHLLEETEAKDTEDWYSRFADLDERILNDNIYNATVEDSRRGRKGYIQDDKLRCKNYNLGTRIQRKGPFSTGFFRATDNTGGI